MSSSPVHLHDNSLSIRKRIGAPQAQALSDLQARCIVGIARQSANDSRNPKNLQGSVRCLFFRRFELLA